MNTVVLVKLPKMPLLANKKSQTAHGIFSLSQVMGLVCIILLVCDDSITEFIDTGVVYLYVSGYHLLSPLVFRRRVMNSDNVFWFRHTRGRGKIREHWAGDWQQARDLPVGYEYIILTR